MSKEVKQIRGQVRQVALALIPEILTEEFYLTVEKRVLAEVTRRLDIIDQRQKEIQGYMVRQSAGLPAAPKKAE